ncbi:MAG: ribonuclease HII [Candidatus Peribacteraceae bacterium]|nr:ribonuclease HII [Candidatus Peribacteraceae bacterium]
MPVAKIIAGVDEAGRGCLAGPVVAAAVILPKNFPTKILADSKKLSEKQREEAFIEIERHAVFGVGEVEAREIDKIGIKKATNLAMKVAVESLNPQPQEIWVDGCDRFRFEIPAREFVRGDAIYPVISAASIVAKVWRDRLMCEFGKKYPGYSFANHKGYGTLHHIRKLLKLRPTAIHRRSFEPLKTWSVQGRLF